MSDQEKDIKSKPKWSLLEGTVGDVMLDDLIPVLRIWGTRPTKPDAVPALIHDLLEDANLGAETRRLRQEIGNLPEEDASALLDKIFPAEAADLSESRDMVIGELAKLAASGPTTDARLLAISSLINAAWSLHRAVGAATAHLEGAGDGD